MARSSLKLDPVTLRWAARKLMAHRRTYFGGGAQEALLNGAEELRASAHRIEAKQKRGRSAKNGPRP